MADAHDTPAARFEALAAAFTGRPGVERGHLFGSTTLTVAGRVFAMLAREALVVKLRGERAAALVETQGAALFEPLPGRRMREWVVVPEGRGDAGRATWAALIEEAFTYVASLAAGGGVR